MLRRSRNMSLFSRFSFVLVIIISITQLAGCKSQKLNSHWLEGEITIDGINNEWGNSTTFIKDENVLIGLMNDENYLYVSLISNNRFMWNRMTGMGFTIWFDPNGGKKKVFGIQYPLGLQEMGEPMVGFGESEQGREKRRQLIEQSLKEIKFLGSKEDDWDRMLVSAASGVSAKVSDQRDSSGAFVYELKVPLRRSEEHPYAIGAEPGKAIGIGFEMQKFDREKMMAGREGGMRGDDMGPPGGMRGGRGGPPGGGMRGGMRRPEMPKPLKIWTKVQLASAK